MMLPLLLLLATSSAAVTAAAADGEGLDATHLVQNLEVVENAPPGTIIGRIGDGIGEETYYAEVERKTEKMHIVGIRKTVKNWQKFVPFIVDRFNY